MSLYLGSNKLKDLYFGSTKINLVYLGSNKVYNSSPTPPEPVDTYRQCYACGDNTLNETTHICSNCGTEFGECPECGAYAVYEQPCGWGHQEWDEESGEEIYVEDYGNACAECGWHEWEDPGEDPGEWDSCPNCGEPYDGEYCGNCGYPDPWGGDDDGGDEPEEPEPSEDELG